MEIGDDDSLRLREADGGQLFDVRNDDRATERETVI
jgi:hypothetical protein